MSSGDLVLQSLSGGMAMPVVTIADIDNDGDADVAIGDTRADGTTLNKLFGNEGHGSYTSVSFPAFGPTRSCFGVGDVVGIDNTAVCYNEAFYPTKVAAFGDIDGDGYATRALNAVRSTPTPSSSLACVLRAAAIWISSWATTEPM